VVSGNSDKIVEVNNLVVHFSLESGFLDRLFSGKSIPYVKAVDGVSFEIKRGQLMGLVGESGCGKSTIGLSFVNLVEKTGGEILFKNKKLTDMDKKEKLKIQIVFQDPFSSLNPLMKVKDIIGRQFIIHKSVPRENIIDEVKKTIRSVELSEDSIYKYPHQFSGGQRQRISIARALAAKPEFLVADEITSALDVSIQAQIIKLLIRLKNEFDLSILFISHDLGVVKSISDTVAVMYLGKLVEFGQTTELFDNPKHPYTKALLSSFPGSSCKQRINLAGDVPSAIGIPEGCRLHPRCPFSTEVCRKIVPDVKNISQTHWYTCHK